MFKPSKHEVIFLRLFKNIQLQNYLCFWHLKTICEKCTMECIQNEKSLNNGINNWIGDLHYMFSDHKPGLLLYAIAIIFIPSWITKWKREIVWINTGVNAKRREGGIMDIKQRKLQLLPLNPSRCTCKMARNLSLSSVGKTEKWFVVEDAENLKTINKIVPVAGYSNSSQGTSLYGVVSHKMKREVFQKVSW